MPASVTNHLALRQRQSCCYIGSIHGVCASRALAPRSSFSNARFGQLARPRMREYGTATEDDFDVCRAASDGIEPLLVTGKDARNIVIFSGSGLSASSGMSMFSTKNGLYQRACKRFNITDGKKLFTWRFYDKQRTEVSSFFVDIHKEAAKAQPGAGHRAVAQLHEEDKLLRHYTMNVDGLATHVRSKKLLMLPCAQDMRVAARSSVASLRAF